jgi:hypothetical protein
LNKSIDVSERIPSGRLFQRWGAAAWKDRAPKVVSILPAGGSSRVPLLDLKLKDDFDLTLMRSLI